MHSMITDLFCSAADWELYVVTWHFLVGSVGARVRAVALQADGQILPYLASSVAKYLVIALQVAHATWGKVSVAENVVSVVGED